MKANTPEMANLKRMTAQRYYDFFYRDDSPVYLLINDVLRPIDNIQYHTVGTTYVGGKFDIFLEGEDECRQVEKHSIVYVGDFHIATSSPDDDTKPVMAQGLIDSPLDDADEWTVTTETHALPPSVVMRKPGDPVPDLRIAPTRPDANKDNADDI